VVEPGATDELLRVMRDDPQIGIVSPRIDYYDSPGVPWFVGSRLDLSQGEAAHENSTIPEGVTDLPWVTGCAMFCRAELLRQTGGFDDRYFLNWEDVDLSLRAAKLGWKLKLAPRAVVRHKVSRSLGKSPVRATYYWHRNRVLLASTHAGTRAVRTVRRDSWRRALRTLWHRERGAWQTCRAIRRALTDARCGRFGAVPA
jgi:GT2 family glycosyltransferase